MINQSIINGLPAGKLKTKLVIKKLQETSGGKRKTAKKQKSRRNRKTVNRRR